MISSEHEMKDESIMTPPSIMTINNFDIISFLPNGCGICKASTDEKEDSTCAECQQSYHTTCVPSEWSMEGEKGLWRCGPCAIDTNTPLVKKSDKEEIPTSVAKTKTRSRGKVKPSQSTVKVLKRKKGSAAAETPTVNVPLNVMTEERITTVVDASLRAGKKFNLLVMERSEEMMQLVHSLTLEIESYITRTADAMEAAASISSDDENEEIPETDVAAAMMPSITEKESDPVMLVNEKKRGIPIVPTERPTHMMNKLSNGLTSLQDLLQQLQFSSVQTEVDLIKEVKVPAEKAAGMNLKNGSTKKGAHSRLYTKMQQKKLEDWYHLSSRPEAAEINSMHRIINSEKHCDRSIQPDGIALKQIRIWFDNRRAKERLDYMKAKLSDFKTKEMDPEELKTMKNDFILEAKEVLEARVSRMRENSTGAQMIVEEGREFGGPELNPPTASPAVKVKTVTSKKRLRIDYVASVRKAVKDARECGKSEEEIKEIREKAIELARERLHIPSKPGRTGKEIGKDEITLVKLKLLKMLENASPPEQVADLMELLGSLKIPKRVLATTNITRQLKLTMKVYKDVKWLLKDVRTLLETFNTILRSENDEVHTNVSGGNCDSPGGTPTDGKRGRVKFSLNQLKKLEKCYTSNVHPGKKGIEKICVKLNAPPLRTGNAPTISNKQVRCWFYKRRAANAPPQALVEADDNVPSGAGEENGAENGDSSTESEVEEEVLAPLTPMSKTIKPKGELKGGRIFSKIQVEFITTAYEKTCRPVAKAVDSMCETLNSIPYQDKERNPQGVTRRQVMTWFSNRRAKERSDFVKSKVKEAQDAGLSSGDVDKVREVAESEIKELMTNSSTSTVPTNNGNGSTNHAPKESSATEEEEEEDVDDDIDDKEDNDDDDMDVDEKGTAISISPMNTLGDDDEDESTEEEEDEDGSEDELTNQSNKRRKLDTETAT